MKLLHTYTVIRPDNVFSSLHNNTKQRANISAITFSYLPYGKYENVIALSRFCDTENEQWASSVFNQRIASDYCIVTSYLSAFILLNYNDICLYKQYAILCQQNQSAFPICWPWGLAGGPRPRMNWSPMCSACHPVGKNGNDSSRVRHWSVVCVKPPHEKHPSAESADGSGEAASSSVTVPTGSQFSNKVSNSVAADRSCATGVGGYIASISRRMRTSRSDDIGTA